MASIADEQALTKEFKISNSMTLNARLDKENYNPGEAITLTIEAIKDNEMPLNGFIEISGAKEISKTISEGKTKEIFAMPETSEAKQYALTVYAYDKIDGEILNEKNETLNFNINQIPSSVVISLVSSEVTPGTEFTYSVDLFDQSGIEIEKTVSINLISPNGEEEQIVSSTESIESIKFEKNATAGNWVLNVRVGELYEEKEITVLENKEIEIELVGPLLLIKNVGNAVYDKTINVKIGEEIKPLELKINVGEERTFNLKAPEGEYDIFINSGQNEIQGRAFLTGNAIDVQNMGGVGFLNKYPIIWIFLVILIGAFATVMYFKSRTKTHKLKPSTKKTKRKLSMSKINLSKKKLKDLTVTEKPEKNVKDFTESKTAKQGAESSLVMAGDKEIASILAIKIPNLPKLGKAAKQELLKILSIAKNNKGMIERKEDYIMAVFSPLVTKTYKNEVLAAKSAEGIKDSLIAYNKLHVDKIPFNIGLNSGEIIASLENGKLKYTSLGNTITLARRIADSDSNKVLVSETLRHKVLKDLKTIEAKEVGKIKTYEVTKVEDREANKEKLQEILKRMKREGNK